MGGRLSLTSKANRNSEPNCISDITTLKGKIELIGVTFVRSILTVYSQSGWERETVGKS